MYRQSTRDYRQNEYVIDHIRIIGYASPEGPLTLNLRLSAARADVLKDYLVAKTGLSSNLFEVVAGGENWNELRVMVEKSNIKEKDRVLDILDHTPEGVDPEIALKKLPGGTYRYMLTNFYPKLRSASSVQLLRIVPVVAPPVVKEEIKVVEVDTVKRTPQKPVVQEPEPCRCDPPLMAIKPISPPGLLLSPPTLNWKPIWAADTPSLWKELIAG